jgi:hypothetical protein
VAPLTTPTITIRAAYADDEAALAALATLDSKNCVPDGALLLAEVDGELRAALSLSSRTVIADPFFHTRDLVALLRRHAEAVGTPARAARRGLGRLRVRVRTVTTA